MVPKIGIDSLMLEMLQMHFLAAFSENAKKIYWNAHNTNLHDISKELYSIYDKSYSIPNNLLLDGYMANWSYIK